MSSIIGPHVILQVVRGGDYKVTVNENRLLISSPRPGPITKWDFVPANLDGDNNLHFIRLLEPRGGYASPFQGRRPVPGVPTPITLEEDPFAWEVLRLVGGKPNTYKIRLPGPGNFFWERNDQDLVVITNAPNSEASIWELIPLRR